MEMQVHKTTEYFGITAEEAAMIRNGSDTVEEAKILDTGEEHYFYETRKQLESDFASAECQEYVKKYGYQILIFELVSDNSNHNKFCMVFE